MISSKLDVIRSTIAEGTGAEISISTEKIGLQSSVKIWFSDLSRSGGPCINFGPLGLKRHNVQLSFGSFSGPIISQIACAGSEEIQLSRALLNSISNKISVRLPDGMDRATWLIRTPSFNVTAEKKRIEDYLSESALEKTCNEIVVPIMAAMAELIGYNEIAPPELNDEPSWEGAERRSTINRRERNPRNRLLCLRIHGNQCKICGISPLQIYGEAGSILEVHHLEPLANLANPRAYCPEEDLVPLCPNCHRAVHTRRPIPWTPHDIVELLQRE